ncbi:hypothetical protein [Methyloglobulus sp.]|uniref:hypothetical protein n=1 Tax=Methyloglobulus sp. TaxID=2518622 RepID=UPI0032B787C7
MTIEDNRTKSLQDFYSAPDESLYGQTVIADVIDCSKAKLERDRWAGTGIPFIKIGRQVKYRKGDVLNWLNQHQPRQSTSETKSVAA